MKDEKTIVGVHPSSFILHPLKLLVVLGLFVIPGCGKEVVNTQAAAAPSAFKESDFEGADDETGEIEVPLIVRDPFQKPAAFVPPPRSSGVVRVVDNGTPVPVAAPEVPVEISWPDIRLSGMVCDIDGKWCAGINGRMVRPGEWITPVVAVSKADAEGVVLKHKSGAIRRINLKGAERGA